jgi:hypothetical protein
MKKKRFITLFFLRQLQSAKQAAACHFQSFAGEAKSLPRGKGVKGAPLGQAPALLTNIKQYWKGSLGTNTLVN